MAEADTSIDLKRRRTDMPSGENMDSVTELERLQIEIAEKNQLLVVVVKENQRLRTLLANYMVHDNGLVSTSQLSQGTPLFSAVFFKTLNADFSIPSESTRRRIPLRIFSEPGTYS